MDDTLKNPELTMLINNKESGYKYRERRQEDWRENYTLYRDRPQINRLTQRQSVNFPLMKQTVRTLLKDIDDMPVLYFENLDNDKQKEIFLNEYWRITAEKNNLELQDIVDKRQVLLFGRSFDQMQIVDGCVKFTVVDPQDILIDRFVDPTDIDSARFLIHSHIYVPLSSLEENDKYDKTAVKRLKDWHMSDEGIVKNSDNHDMATQKNQKMADMGVQDVDDPVLGETMVELSLHFVYRKEESDDEEQLYLYVEADNYCILMKERLEGVIGKTKDNYWRNHLPYNTWADDVERQDFWSDGVADIVRTPNIVLNTWFSQQVENRTMRSFGMHYYRSSLEGFSPGSFNPLPWGWYPIPAGPNEKISDVISKVDIPDLSESLDEMTFVMEMINRASGATSTQQGVQTERQVTLGEVQLALGEAKERVKGLSKFYTPAWKKRGEKFLKLLEAAPEKLDAVTAYKKGRNTDAIYSKEITPQSWQSKKGYGVRIWSQDERDKKNTENITKINAIKANMPDNPVVDRVYKRKLLEFGDFSPDDINEAIRYEDEKLAKQAQMAQMQAQMQQMAQMPQMGQLPVPQQV